MKIILLSLITLLPIYLFAQYNDDQKILIKFDNELNIYNRVKDAFVLKDFLVKDLSNKDVVLTYPYNYTKIDAFVICKAIINGNTVSLSGEWGKSGANLSSDNVIPKNYKPIVYYKGSKTWQLLVEVASLMGGEISFSK